MRQKKAQQAAEGVYIFLILIGLFIVLYVIILPPADRESLLNETTTATSDLIAKSVLLSESPGKVYATTVKQQTINLEPVHLYAVDQTESSVLVKSMTVSRNLLKNNLKKVFFKIDDLNQLKKAQILFFITESKGPLTVYLNDKLIFEGKITTKDMPLNLPLQYLKENNQLKFISKSTGINIFSTNYYIIKELTLLKTLKKENKNLERTFSIAEETGQNVNNIALSYYITCNEDTNPRLTIKVNSRKVFEDIITCSYTEKREVALTKSEVNVYGRNKIEFEINKGDIEINGLKLNMKLKKSMHPMYSFDITNSLWNNIKNGDSKIVLRLKFANDGRKRAKIYVQDQTITMDTNADYYVKDISEFVDNGANIIKIIPLNNYEILNLKVLEE